MFYNVLRGVPTVGYGIGHHGLVSVRFWVRIQRPETVWPNTATPIIVWYASEYIVYSCNAHVRPLSTLATIGAPAVSELPRLIENASCTRDTIPMG